MNIFTSARHLTVNSVYVIFNIIRIFFILIILPHIIDIIAIGCSRRNRKLLHSITIPWIRFNKHIFKELNKLSIKIYRYISLSIKFKSFNALFRMEDLKKLIMNLDPEEFEHFCAKVYRKLGYKATVSQFGNDGGKDIILTDKEHNLIYVECKRCHEEYGREIGREICQKLIGSCASDGVKKAILVTTGKLHKNAFEYQKNINSTKTFNLELVDFDELINLYIKAYGISKTNEIRNGTVR